MTPRDVRQIATAQLERFWPEPIDLLGGVVYLPDILYTPPEWGGKKIDFDRMDPDIDQGSVLAIGDSQVASLALNSISPFAVNLGIAGEPIRAVCHRLSGMTAFRRAGGGIFLSGVNDMYRERLRLQDDPDGGTFRMLETVRFEFTKLSEWFTGKWVVCHVLPVNESMPGAAGVFNADIITVNEHIDSLFSLRADARIVNAGLELAPNGVLLPVNTIDGIHLSAAGKVILRRHIRAALADLGI